MTTGAPHHPGTVHRPARPRIAAVVVLLAVFMTNLDLWIVNVALPAMGQSFTTAGHPASLQSLSWVLNAYAITLAALLVVMGRLGDRIGQRPIFLAGLILFTLASVACALAPTLPFLIAARVAQAVGAAAQLPTSLGLLLSSVTTDRRTSATRTWAAVGGLAAVAGPVLGGLLVQIDWRWVFIVNLPIGVLALAAGWVALPTPASRESGALPDLWGAALITVCVATLSGALVQAPTWGWTSPGTFALLAVSVLTATWFARRSAQHPRPLLELPLLLLPRFGIASAGTLLFSASIAIMLLSNVLWCQDVWHWSALRTGLALVPGPGLVPVITVLTARTVKRLGHGPLVAAGGTFFAAGMLWRVVAVTVTPDYVGDLLPSMLLTGIGVGLTIGTLVAASVESLPSERAATGSALVNSVRQIASTLGVAILVTLLGTRIGAGSVANFRVAWALTAGLSLATALIGVLLRGNRRTQTTTDPASSRAAVAATTP